MPFEILGYFEEIWNEDTQKMVGTRSVAEQPGRECGYKGAQSFVITSPLTIQKGHKEFTIKASAKKPVRLRSTLNKICGRLIESKK